MRSIKTRTFIFLTNKVLGKKVRITYTVKICPIKKMAIKFMKYLLLFIIKKTRIKAQNLSRLKAQYRWLKQNQTLGI